MRKYTRIQTFVAALVAITGLAMLSAMPVNAQSRAGQVAPQRVPGSQISSLIRNTLSAVNHANLTGNYTVLRDLGSSSFRSGNTASSLSDVFRPFRKAQLNLSDTVLFDPRLVGGAKLNKSGVLQVKGLFLTKPQNVTFDLTYQYENGFWRVALVSIGFQPHQEKAAQRAVQKDLGKTRPVNATTGERYVPRPKIRPAN